VLFLLDTVRASDAYNNPSLTFINSLSRAGVNYGRTIAPGTWTAPSHASLFMDSNVSAIRNVSKDFFSEKGTKIDPWMVKNRFLPENANTIAQKMSRLGYMSLLFSSNPFLTSETNLATGFDLVYDVWMHANIKYNKDLVDKFSFIINGGESAREKMYKLSDLFTRALPKPIFDRLYLYLRTRLNFKVAAVEGATELDRGAADINRVLIRYLERDYQAAQHFFFLNYMEGHENYPVGPNTDVVQDKWLYLSGIRELDSHAAKVLHRGYLKRIKYLDRKMGEALEAMRRNGVLDNAIVVATSDHGQLFGEHGSLYHSTFPYEGIAHVPLIAARYSNGKLVNVHENLDRPVSLRSLHNALLGVAKGKEEYLNGNMRMDRYVVSEHAGIIEGWDEPLLRRLKNRSDYARRIYDAKSYHNTKATAVYSGDLKLMHFFGKRADELYNLSVDPQELDNIIDGHRNEALRLAREVPSAT